MKKRFLITVEGNDPENLEIAKNHVVSNIKSYLKVNVTAKELPQQEECKPKLFPKELTNIAFPRCSCFCSCVETLGVGECENVCVDKFKPTPKVELPTKFCEGVIRQTEVDEWSAYDPIRSLVISLMKRHNETVEYLEREKQ